MKKIYFIIFFSIFSILSIKASHLSYTDITYKYIIGNTYEITLTTYRDCGGAAAPTTISIPYCALAGTTSGAVNLFQVAGTGTPIFPICSFPSSVCIGGTDEGFQKYVYKGTTTLPSARNDWTFTYTYCCREPIITNVLNPLSAGTSIKFTINNLDFPGNSSATFNDEPVLFACCNQSFSYNQSATDIDGDSLAYSLYYPMNDITTCTTSTNITYNGSFNYTNFITSSPAISMNPLTGYLTMYPTICSEISIMGIKVEEYRGGVLIGSILRDNMVIVTNQTTVGSQDIAYENNLFIYPNPSNDRITVSLSKNIITCKKTQSLKIFNTLGETVYSSNAISEKTEVNLSSFKKGMYLVQLQIGNEKFNRKIIKN